MFLAEKGITVPRQFRREHCFEYINVWRKKANKSEGKYKAGHNTALLEIKLIGLLMGEAYLRGYAPGNPCYKLKIRRLQGKVKPELNAEAVKMIRDAIQSDPVLKAEPKLKQFFNNSFEIAYHHGVRLSETYFNPQECVRFVAEDKAIITFLNMKGEKINSVYLHPNLIELMRELLDSGATETYTPPSSPAKYWFNFLTRHGVKKKFPNACFHSTRVTVATKLARAGVPEKQAMAFIKHASTTVHRMYVRLQPEDLESCLAAIS
jgi:integrase